MNGLSAPQRQPLRTYPRPDHVNGAASDVVGEPDVAEGGSRHEIVVSGSPGLFPSPRRRRTTIAKWTEKCTISDILGSGAPRLGSVPVPWSRATSSATLTNNL